MKKRRRQPLPKATRDKYICLDCGMNVLVGGEFYMLKSRIWNDQLGLGWDDNLCIGCVEARLGRKLVGLFPGGDIASTDFGPSPDYPWMPKTPDGRPKTSDRLMDRYGFAKNAMGKWEPKSYPRRKPKARAVASK